MYNSSNHALIVPIVISLVVIYIVATPFLTTTVAWLSIAPAAIEALSWVAFHKATSTVYVPSLANLLVLSGTTSVGLSNPKDNLAAEQWVLPP